MIGTEGTEGKRHITAGSRPWTGARTVAVRLSTLHPGGLEDYDLVPAQQRAGGEDDFHLPIAGYGHLCFLVDRVVRDFRGLARDLALEPVAHVLNLRKHNLLSVKWLALAELLDASMSVYPAAAAAYDRSRKQADASSLGAIRCGPRYNIEFH